MGVTVVSNDDFAEQVGRASIPRHSPASPINLVWGDEKGKAFRVVRGVNDENITAIVLKNTNGVDCFIYPNENGDGPIVTTTAP